MGEYFCMHFCIRRQAIPGLAKYAFCGLIDISSSQSRTDNNKMLEQDRRRAEVCCCNPTVFTYPTSPPFRHTCASLHHLPRSVLSLGQLLFCRYTLSVCTTKALRTRVAHDVEEDLSYLWRWSCLHLRHDCHSNGST